MPHYDRVVLSLDEEQWLFLHDVRLRGLVAVETTTEGHAEQLAGLGLVHVGPRGVRVTPEGRVAHTEWALVVADDEVTTRRAYERFLPLNRELITVCNDWQVRPGGVPNDHRDARYDWEVIDRVRALDERVGPVVNKVARTVTRFEVYRPLLRAALARVDDGESDWLTSPRCDSYHTVWMLLHEDLLLALGEERSSEEPI